jgi:hypothetical protein
VISARISRCIRCRNQTLQVPRGPESRLPPPQEFEVVNPNWADNTNRSVRALAQSVRPNYTHFCSGKRGRSGPLNVNGWIPLTTPVRPIRARTSARNGPGASYRSSTNSTAGAMLPSKTKQMKAAPISLRPIHSLTKMPVAVRRLFSYARWAGAPRTQHVTDARQPQTECLGAVQPRPRDTRL